MNKKVKLIAFHLPQFHTFPENDEWWGEGFTEWTNVKKAKPLFDKHYQPREPLNDRYYDLSKLNNMLWQMKLAEEYGVYGFCYYHYWFNGKLLMEKPLESIRDYDKHKLPYCLCWANEPWTRAWDGDNKSVIMPQVYGDVPEWKKHFEYLLTFFKDDSYMKIDNKPILVLYRCNNIPKCDEMISCWDQWCKKEGFEGIYLIEELNTFQSKADCINSSAILEFEPMYTTNNDRNLYDKIIDKLYLKMMNKKNKTNCEHIYRYDNVWKKILNRKHENKDKKDFFHGAFVDWDNTPRKGDKSIFYTGSTPEKFEKYLNILKLNAEKEESNYIFINAWNEWGEGAYLEPDKKNKLRYLESVKNIFNKEK